MLTRLNDWLKGIEEKVSVFSSQTKEPEENRQKLLDLKVSMRLYLVSIIFLVALVLTA